MTISMAFPYTRGRRQEPLSERILTNDLYGIPLYQPSVGADGTGPTDWSQGHELTQTLLRTGSSGGHRSSDAMR